MSSRQSEREAFRSEFSSLLAAALAPSESDKVENMAWQSSTSSSLLSTQQSETPLLRIPTIDQHPIYRTSRTIMDQFKAMLTEYDELAHRTANCQLPEDLTEVWEKDYAEVRRLISVGRVATEAEIERLLTYDGDKRHRSRGEGRMDTDPFRRDAHLQAMLEMGRQDRKDQKDEKKVYGWGKAAHRAEKGFRDLVRALPDED